MASVTLDWSKISPEVVECEAGDVDVGAPERRQRHDDEGAHGQDGGDERVTEEGDGGELGRTAWGAERLAAVGDEALAIPEEELLQPDDDHAEHEQGRAERGRIAVLDRRLGHVAVDLGGDDVDAGGTSEEQRPGELPETEQQGDAAAVQQGRAQ